MSLIKGLVIGFSAAAMLLGSSVAMVAAATPVIRYVDDEGGGPAADCGGHEVYSTSIQVAIDDSSPGDQVVVCPGVYQDYVGIATPRLTVRGFTPWTATVRSRPDHVDGQGLIGLVNAPGAKVKWLKVEALTEGTCGEVGAMIAAVNSPNAEIRANHIGIVGTDGLGSCGFGIGILVQQSANAHILWNTVTNYKNSGLNVGISDNLLVRGNTTRWLHRSGSADFAQGIEVFGANPGARILHNVVVASVGSVHPLLSEYGINVNVSGALVRGNTIRNIDTAIRLNGASHATVRDNVAKVGIATGIFLQATGDSNIFGNVFSAVIGALAGEDSENNNLHDNDFRGAGPTDCLDQSFGSGTGGTANIWTNDQGTGVPPEICSEF